MFLFFSRISDSSIFWWMLAAARLYLASVQTGYIHPDEFHQSVQVMARKYCVIWGCLGGGMFVLWTLLLLL